MIFVEQGQVGLPQPYKSFNNTDTDPASHQPAHVFYHTSPNQIVRQQAPITTIPSSAIVSRVTGVVQEQPSSPALCEPGAIESPDVVSTPQTNSSQKSSQRGRPKGSKNKP